MSISASKAFEVEAQGQRSNKVSEREVVGLMRARAERGGLAFQNTWDHDSMGGERACDGVGEC